MNLRNIIWISQCIFYFEIKKLLRSVYETQTNDIGQVFINSFNPTLCTIGYSLNKSDCSTNRMKMYFRDSNTVEICRNIA